MDIIFLGNKNAGNYCFVIQRYLCRTSKCFHDHIEVIEITPQYHHHIDIGIWPRTPSRLGSIQVDSFQAVTEDKRHFRS